MTPRALPLAAALAALLAGCGGEDRLSTEDYRAQAVRICQASERETDRLGQPKTPAEFKAWLDERNAHAVYTCSRFEAALILEHVAGLRND